MKTSVERIGRKLISGTLFFAIVFIAAGVTVLALEYFGVWFGIALIVALFIACAYVVGDSLVD